MRVPALQAVRVLGAQLAAGAVVIRITIGTLNWPPDMWQQARRVVHDLVQRQQAEVDGHDLHDGAHSGQGGPDPGADEPGLRQRGVTDALRRRTPRAAPGSRRISRRSSPMSSPIRKTRSSRCIASRIAGPHRLAVALWSSPCQSAPPVPTRPATPLAVDEPGELLDRLGVPASANATARSSPRRRPAAARRHSSVGAGRRPPSRRGARVIGSRSIQRATSALSRYRSGSNIECARKR